MQWRALTTVVQSNAVDLRDHGEPSESPGMSLCIKTIYFLFFSKAVIGPPVGEAESTDGRHSVQYYV